MDARPDVTIGGGSSFFEEKAKAGTYEGKPLSEQAKARGFHYITEKADLGGVKEANQQKPLLALLSPGNMPVK